MTLTPAQQQAADCILTAFRAYVAMHQHPPSVRELSRATGYVPSHVHRIVRLMQAAGLVEVEDGTARGIRIVEG